MKRIACLASALVLALSVVGLSAQAPKMESFMGIVKSVSQSSITVERGTITGVFSIDSKTHVAARGATAKTKEAKEAGRAGLTVPDAVHVGDQVVIKFMENKGAMMATDIQVRTQSVQLKK